MLFRTTLDTESSKPLWKSKATDEAAGYSMTVAVLLAAGAVITGVSGGEFGTDRCIEGRNPADGKHL